MKRFYWLLALPYVVVSSRTITTSGKYEFWTTYTHVSKSDNKFGFMECGNDKDLCDDLAAALNEAHSHRIFNDSLPSNLRDTDNAVEYHVPNQQACGQNDCGQDPK